MKKLFMGLACSLCAITTANASIISRSFLDEALTNYATSTALDLKADKSDLTALSEIVGTPAELTYGDVFVGPITDLFEIDYIRNVLDKPFPTNNISEFIRLSFTDLDFPGVYGILNALISARSSDESWPIRLGEIFDDYALLYATTGKGSFWDALQFGGTLRNGDFYGLPKLTEEVDKIGTLPTEYATVGAALSAIKGIAEEAKQKAEAAIPDPKAEGATGKFVLTVDVVGDNATYRWEKIERATGETGTTTQ